MFLFLASSYFLRCQNGSEKINKQIKCPTSSSRNVLGYTHLECTFWSSNELLNQMSLAIRPAFLPQLKLK